MENLGHTTITERDVSSVYPPSVGFLPNYVTPRKRIQNRFVFCAVRNIFSWLVSYAGHAGGGNPKYHDPHHYDYERARKGFDYLVRTIADREDDIWPCRKLIHFQVFSDGGSLIPDYLARKETLDEDLYELSRELGLHYCKKPRQRTGMHKNYRGYYTDSLVDLVCETWGREIKLFGYSFDGMDVSKALLKRRIDKQTKARIQYFWETDKLLIDGEELHPSSC
jgi:hypothetical protein